MEVVILRDLVASYASTWVNIATTAGIHELHVGDVFRQSGSGEGAEELRVDAFEVSQIPGGSRMLLLRAHHSTVPESYRLGAVLKRIEAALEIGPGMKPIPLQTEEKGVPKSSRKPPVPSDLLSEV